VESNPVITSLLALRNSLLASLANVDAVLSLVDMGEESDQQEEAFDGECQHPMDYRKQIPTMGRNQWFCKLCGFTSGEGGE